MLLRYRVFVSSFLLTALLAFTACGRHETPVQSGNREKILHFGNGAEPRDLDPQTNIGEPDGFVITALFEPLVCVANDGSTILPGVAERWDVSPDGKIYTFHLRANAKWSNGETVTAQDFYAGFTRLIEPALACEASSEAYFIEGARDYIEGRNTDLTKVGLRVVDPRTFEIKLINRTPFFLGLLGNWPFMPVHLATVEKFGGLKRRDSPWTRPENFVGNGRFLLKEWLPNQVIAVTKNPAHWDAANTHLNGIRFYPIEDPSTEENAFRSGQLHVTFTLPMSKVPGYRAGKDLRITPLQRTQYVTFNTKVAPFQDERVRRAFALAIDRERLVTSARMGLGQPGTSLTRPDTGGYKAPTVFSFDPVAARRLLAEAGYPGGKGFPAIECMLTAKSGSAVVEGEVIQQMWAQNLGVHVSLQPTEFKVYLEAIRIRKFQCVIEAWGYINDPWDPLQVGVTGNPNNDTEWSNAAYDRAFADAEKAPNDEQRHADFDTMEKLLGVNAPYASLYFFDRARLVQPSVLNWRDTPVGAMNWGEFSLADK